MTELLSEAIGTFVLILFGCGLNAGLSLNNTHSNKDSNGWARNLHNPMICLDCISNSC